MREQEAAMSTEPEDCGATELEQHGATEPEDHGAPEPEQRREVAEAARVLSRLGLVTAYGHVSVRSGAAMLITPGAS
jgi:hypothetical protein